MELNQMHINAKNAKIFDNNGAGLPLYVLNHLSDSPNNSEAHVVETTPNRSIRGVGKAPHPPTPCRISYQLFTKVDIVDGKLFTLP